MRKLVGILLPILLFTVAPAALAHAFPDNSSPHVGATLTTSPKVVKVWFDGQLEPVFSTLIVKSADGRQVSQGKGKVDSSNPALLEADVPSALPAGKYTVYWSVIAHDGHHTEGHFNFSIK